MTSESCESCKLYRKPPIPEHHRNGRGDCHLQPKPLPVIDTHFCGQWRAKEPTGWKCLKCDDFYTDGITIIVRHCYNAHGCSERVGAKRV